MKKIVSIIGARPQFIKAAALSRSIRHINDKENVINDIIIHTGQHYDYNMSEVFFKEMDMPTPSYHLGIGGCSQGAMTGRMIEAIEEILVKEKPDWTVIYGDTNSTLAGALAAVKLHLPIAHIEAGLRSFNRLMPEEINRILADQCSDILFTPVESATQQLLREGISRDKIVQVGDVLYDAALHYQKIAQEQSRILEKNVLTSKEYVLATIHRAENTDHPQRLREIFLGLQEIANETTVVLPLHPRTKMVLDRLNLLTSFSSNLKMIDPVGYIDMIQLETNAKVIITDSGGVQKEAYFFQVPCLTMREETEWSELVGHGFNQLVPANCQEIVKRFQICTEVKFDLNRSLYGKGAATFQILHHLLNS